MSKIDLKRITAVCIDGRPYDEARYGRYNIILNFFLANIEFGSVKMITTRNPGIEGVSHIKIDEFDISGYSKFCLHELTRHVDTEFCLIFQDDGFIVNPNAWNDLFYDYDYIGSPWPLYMGWPKEGQQVGNGGFSLRSKKLLEFTKTFAEHSTQNEDTYIVSDRRESVINAGLKIAPVEIARLFSVENPIDNEHNINTCFGFHSKNKTEDAIEKINTHE